MASDNIVSFRRPGDDRRSYEEAVRAQQVEPWGPIRDYAEPFEVQSGPTDSIRFRRNRALTALGSIGGPVSRAEVAPLSSARGRGPSAGPQGCSSEGYAPDLYRSRAEQERIDRLVEDIRRDDRAMFWQGMVKGFCIVTAYLTVIYFFWQLGRGAF